MNDLELTLQEYVATANDPKANGDWDLINSKFPELADFDPVLLREYVKTANDPKANGDYDVINSKFPEFSGDMESQSDDGSLESSAGDYEIETSTDLLTAGLTRKVPTTKNFVKDIFNTQDSVKKDDEKVKSRAIEKYFSLDAMPNRKTKEVFVSEYATETVFVEPKEEELRAYFKDAKYEEYKKYKETGELPASIKFKSDVEVEQKNRKRELTEQYIGINVPEEKQIEAYLALPSVIGDEKEVIIDGKTYKNPKELYNTLKKRDAELGTTKAIDLEADYLAAANEGFNNDYEKYETD